MIFICSAGRSGSAWLTTLFSACGMKSRHDLYPINTDVDVESHTGWLWDIDGFCDRLAARSQKHGVCDTVILLSRPREEIENSVATLLNRKEDWSRVFQQWEELQDRVWRTTQILQSGYKVDYRDMFKPEFKKTLKRILWKYPEARSRVDDAWDFLVNMRVTNKAVEQETVESYGPIKN